MCFVICPRCGMANNKMCVNITRHSIPHFIDATYAHIATYPNPRHNFPSIVSQLCVISGIPRLIG